MPEQVELFRGLVEASEVVDVVRHAAQIHPPSNPGQAAEVSKNGNNCFCELIVEDRGQLVTLRIEGAPAPKYGPGKGRKPRPRGAS